MFRSQVCKDMHKYESTQRSLKIIVGQLWQSKTAHEAESYSDQSLIPEAPQQPRSCYLHIFLLESWQD